ncbi:MAG: fibronectin type III domain-containing protein [Saprospiraceae bacterium]|nr:fibronectin type III domain-containing protein [Saprospiraceae bacterium]
MSVDDASAVLYCDIPTALKYEFRYRIKNTQPWTFTPITDKPGVGLKGLYADTSYEFQCRIACQAAVSPWSRSKNFRTRSSIDCSPPLFNNLFVREIKTKDARLNCAINGVLGFDWRYREPDSLTWLPLPASRKIFIMLIS